MSLADFAELPGAVDGVSTAVDSFNAQLDVYEKTKKTIVGAGVGSPSTGVGASASPGKGAGKPDPGEGVSGGAQSLADSLAHLDAVLAGLSGPSTYSSSQTVGEGDQTFYDNPLPGMPNPNEPPTVPAPNLPLPAAGDFGSRGGEGA